MENNDIYSIHEKFHVAVDCVILSYVEEELRLLLYPRDFNPYKGTWSLMGGFVKQDESANSAAKRVLKKTVGLENIYLEQVGNFSEPNRDLGGRVISFGYYSLIRNDEYRRDLVREHGAHWWPINILPELLFDHKDIVDEALTKLRRKSSIELVGRELLPKMFTLTQLHNLYNAIFQKQFDAGNFRKKLNSLNVLEKLAVKDTENSKRGAYFYKFKDIEPEINTDRIVKL